MSLFLEGLFIEGLTDIQIHVANVVLKIVDAETLSHFTVGYSGFNLSIRQSEHAPIMIHITTKTSWVHGEVSFIRAVFLYEAIIPNISKNIVTKATFMIFMRFFDFFYEIFNVLIFTFANKIFNLAEVNWR